MNINFKFNDDKILTLYNPPCTYHKVSGLLFLCISQDASKQNADGRLGCAEDIVIAEISCAAVIIAAELLVASLSSCNNDISGDCKRSPFKCCFLT